MPSVERHGAKAVAQWALLVSHLVEQGLGAKVSIRGWKRVGPCCLRARELGRGSSAHSCLLHQPQLPHGVDVSPPLREQVTGLVRWVRGTFRSAG